MGIRHPLPQWLRRALGRVYYPLYRAGVRLWCAWESLSDARVAREEGISALPPAALRFRVAETPSARYFAAVGRNTVRDIETCLDAAGLSMSSFGKILDFGCGCGRTLYWLHGKYPEKALFGVDTDAEAIAWCRRNLAFAEFHNNQPRPPLPIAGESMDLIYAVSVFTHLGPEMERPWLEELHRVLRPGGVALLTVYGRAARERLGNEIEREVQRRGAVFLESRKLEGIFPRWYQTCLRSEAYVRQAFGREFGVEKLLPEGMGEHDVVICRKRR